LDGGVYYIEPSGGFDTNSGQSPAAAWRSLGKASQTMLPPGTQVLVKGGETMPITAANRIVPTSSGSAGLPIVWSSYGGDGGRPILDGTNAGAVQAIFINSQSWHTVRGFEIRNFQTYAVYLSNTNNVTLDDVHIHDVVEGIHPTPVTTAAAFTMRNGSIRNVRLAPDGGGQSRAISIVPTSVNWRIENVEVSDVDQSCISDQGTGTLFDNVNVHDCGQANVTGDRQALWLRGSASIVRFSRFARATGDCVQIGVLDGGILLGNQLSGCDNCINLTGNAGGDVLLRRNAMGNCYRLVAQSNPSPKLVNLAYVNNTFAGGLVDGGPSLIGVVMRPGSRGVFENNVIAGNIAPPGFSLVFNVSSGWDAGFTERGNAYESDGGAQFSYDTFNGTYSAWAATAGLPAVSHEGPPSFAGPFDPRLNPDSGYRDRGVATTSIGTLAMGCDGGANTYCGAAPEPGAFELIP
jgi:hypothetical protein